MHMLQRHQVYRAVVILIGSSLLLPAGCGRADTLTPETAPAAAPVNQVVTATVTPRPTLIFETPKIELTEIAQREQYELETALAGTPAPPKILPTDEPTSWPPPTPYWVRTTPLAGGGQLKELSRWQIMRSFFSNNAWIYIVDEEHYLLIEAGERKDTDAQVPPVEGGVTVSLYRFTVYAESKLVSYDYYPTPTRSGSARLVDALVSGADIWVQVTTTGGDTFVFNVTTRTWEDTTALPR